MRQSCAETQSEYAISKAIKCRDVSCATAVSTDHDTHATAAYCLVSADYAMRRKQVSDSSCAMLVSKMHATCAEKSLLCCVKTAAADRSAFRRFLQMHNFLDATSDCETNWCRRCAPTASPGKQSQTVHCYCRPSAAARSQQRELNSLLLPIGITKFPQAASLSAVR